MKVIVLSVSDLMSPCEHAQSKTKGYIGFYNYILQFNKNDYSLDTHSNTITDLHSLHSLFFLALLAYFQKRMKNGLTKNRD